MLQWHRDAEEYITCLTPPGVGTDFTVVVKVSQLCNTIGCASDASQHADASAPVTVSYDPPTITSVVPNHGPTLGGYNVTLQGASFAATGATVALATMASGRVVTLNLPVLDQNHTHVTVVMQPAAGVFLNVTVSVGGQSTTLVGGWSYDAPVIYEIRPLDKRNDSETLPCPAYDASAPCVVNWIAAPSSDISVIGKNFGPDASYASLVPIVIMIGDFSCVARPGSPSVYIADNLYVAVGVTITTKIPSMKA